MKKLAIFIFLVISCGSWCRGQVLLGPKLGLHAGKVKYDRASFQDQFDPNLKLGYNVGFGLTLPVSDPVSLHIEIQGADKGKEVSIPLVSLKNKTHYYYLEMPLMMRYQILPQQGIFIGIGPNLSYWLAGKGSLTNIEETSTPVDYSVVFGADGGADDLVVPQPNRLQLGLLLGIGTLLKSRDDRLILMEIRVEMGHSHLADAAGGTINDPEFFDNLESKHQLISFNLGYFWSLHKKNAKKRSHSYKAKPRR